MSTDGVDKLADLLAEAESLTQAIDGASQPLQEVVESSDQAGAVSVTLEDHGRRVTRIVVATNWQDRVPAEALGAAVVEAVMSVQLRQVRDFFAAATDDAPQASRRPPARPASASVELPSSWDELGSMVETLHRALDAIVQAPTGQELPDAAASRVVGQSENRRVEVALVAGELSAVTIDTSWAAQASRQKLSDSLLEAFEAAHAAEADRQREGGGRADLSQDLQSILGRFGMDTRTPPQGRPHD